MFTYQKKVIQSLGNYGCCRGFEFCVINFTYKYLSKKVLATI